MKPDCVDYYFWASSDWSFLGHDRFLDLCRAAEVQVRYCPVRPHELLSATGGLPLKDRSPARQAYREAELRRWSALLNVPLVVSPRAFPVDNEPALRLFAGAQTAGVEIAGLIRSVMAALWIEDRDIADNDVLTGAAAANGISEAKARDWIASAACGDRLAANTASAIEAGAFGAPSYVVAGEVFWGQDRLDMLARRLGLPGHSPRNVGVVGSWRGELLGIYSAEIAGVEMDPHESKRLVAGSGVENDRYATGEGYYSGKPHADRQVTLIEQEVLEALERDHDIVLPPEETRRNLLTRGVPLNHLVGRRFWVGDVELYGGRLNVPCKYLERLLDKKVFDPLINRSGLNCQILNTGDVRVGDTIAPSEARDG